MLSVTILASISLAIVSAASRGLDALNSTMLATATLVETMPPAPRLLRRSCTRAIVRADSQVSHSTAHLVLHICETRDWGPRSHTSDHSLRHQLRRRRRRLYRRELLGWAHLQRSRRLIQVRVSSGILGSQLFGENRPLHSQSVSERRHLRG